MKKLYLLIFMLFFIGVANAQYDFSNISFSGNWFNPNEPVATSYNIKYNGIWGWHDGTGNEYAIVGAASGTYFIDVTNPTNPVQRDYVQGRRNNCIWREIKTYQNYCYMVSDDAAPNSLQIVDLSYLPDSVHVVYDSNTLFERCHTIWIDGSHLYGGSVTGGSVGYAPMAVFDLTNPASPVLLRNVAADFNIPGSQVHDMFVKNDTVYASCGMDGLYIFKFNTNNTFQYINSLTSYVDQGYNHSSTLDESGQYLYFTDEVPAGMDVKVLDVSNLNNLTVVDNFHSNDLATPHNPFVKGNILYIAYYQDGLQAFDISNPAAPVLAGYFDTYYQNPAGTYPNPPYAGAWGAYPWLPSGNLLVSDMQNGLFILDVSALSASVPSHSAANFVIRPNPALPGGTLNIESPADINGEFTIRDVTGKIVFTKQVNGRINTIRLPLITNGLYLTELRTTSSTSVRKLVIE